MSSSYMAGSKETATFDGLDVSQVAMLASIDMVLDGVLQQLSNIAMFNSLGEKAERVMGDSIMHVSDMLRAISFAFEKFCPISAYCTESNDASYNDIKRNLERLGVKTYKSIWDNPKCSDDNSLRLLGQKTVEVNRLEEGHKSGEVLKNLASFSYYPLQFGRAMVSGLSSGHADVVDKQVVNITGFVALYKRYLSMILKGEDLTKRPEMSSRSIKTIADFDFGNITASAIFSAAESRISVGSERYDAYLDNLRDLDIIISDVFDEMPKNEVANRLAALL